MRVLAVAGELLFSVRSFSSSSFSFRTLSSLEAHAHRSCSITLHEYGKSEAAAKCKADPCLLPSARQYGNPSGAWY